MITITLTDNPLFVCNSCGGSDGLKNVSFAANGGGGVTVCLCSACRRILADKLKGDD